MLYISIKVLCAMHKMTFHDSRNCRCHHYQSSSQHDKHQMLLPLFVVTVILFSTSAMSFSSSRIITSTASNSVNSINSITHFTIRSKSHHFQCSPFQLYKQYHCRRSLSALANSADYNDNNYIDPNPFGPNSPFSTGTKTNPNEFKPLPSFRRKYTPRKNTNNIEEMQTINQYNAKRLSLYESKKQHKSIIGSKAPYSINNDIAGEDENGSNIPPNIKQLKDELKQYRIQQSKPVKKPAYTIFTNAALDGIYDTLPTTKEELINIKGIGPKKIEMFGDDILQIVSKYTKGADSVVEGIQTKKKNLPIRTVIDRNSLTKEQKYAAGLVLGKERQNVFITGSAGTGKSYLLKYIVQELQKGTNADGGDSSITGTVGVCATTGVAAIIAGGNTLHSYFGIGLGNGSQSSLLRKVRKNQKVENRINDTVVLIIDECSMLSSNLLEKLDYIAREVRHGGEYKHLPFGGMQIVAFGDFFQLPPVHRESDVIGNDNGTTDRTWRPYCFDSQVWSDLGLRENIVALKEVQRQDDEDFINLLNKVRVGSMGESDIKELNSKCLLHSTTNPLPEDGILPTRLYVLNRDVDSENISRLAEIQSEEIICKARDSWREDMPLGTLATTKKKMVESLSMEMPDEIKLKVGAQVMLTRNKNLERHLVNGSRGVIENFVLSSDGLQDLIPIVRFDNGIVTKIDPVESIRYNPDGGEGCLVRTQIPLKLAWAITIHKSQGSTLTRALLDITSAFEYGQCYVALSRVKSLEGLWLEKPARLSNILVSPQVTDFFGTNGLDSNKL